MTSKLTRGLTLAVCCSCLMAGQLSAETIIRLEFGTSGPDIEFNGGELSTFNDGNLAVTSPGDQDTDATFDGFVADAGFANITSDASFTLSGITAVEHAVTFGTRVNQSTTGGTFELFDTDGSLLLSAELEDGVLVGPSSSSGVSTGSFFTVQFGNFSGPVDPDGEIFQLLKEDSAQLSMSFTNISDDSGQSGFSVVDGVLQGFTADVTAQIEAEAAGNAQLPEPASYGLAMMGALAFLGLRRRR